MVKQVQSKNKLGFVEEEVKDSTAYDSVNNDNKLISNLSKPKKAPRANKKKA